MICLGTCEGPGLPGAPKEKATLLPPPHSRAGPKHKLVSSRFFWSLPPELRLGEGVDIKGNLNSFLLSFCFQGLQGLEGIPECQKCRRPRVELTPTCLKSHTLLFWKGPHPGQARDKRRPGYLHPLTFQGGERTNLVGRWGSGWEELQK